MKSIDKNRPFLGLESYKEINKDVFGGRDNELLEIQKKISRSKIVYIYGKSGIGKSSLIQAGLMPLLRNSFYLPIYARLDYSDASFPPLLQLKTLIKEGLTEFGIRYPFDNKQTLWEIFNRLVINNGLVKIAIIIDQFEEVFTLSKDFQKIIQPFFVELSDLIQNSIPLSLQSKLKYSPSIDFDHRIVISLREDFLPQLNNLKKYLPFSNSYSFRVTYLFGSNALISIAKLGKELLTEKVAIQILNRIPESSEKEIDLSEFDNKQSWDSRHIEPFILSLFLYQLNEVRLSLNKRQISKDIVEKYSINEIIKNHYTLSTTKISSSVLTVLEDKLVSDDGFRKLFPLNEIMTLHNILKSDIITLINNRILRIVQRNNIEYIEFIHDILIPIIIEKRKNKYNSTEIELDIKNYPSDNELLMELRRAKDKAEESDRLKSAFLANISHEIRTPLNGIIGFTELIASEELDPKQLNSYKGLIHSNANQLLSIINDIVDISKIESNQVVLDFASFNLSKTLHDLNVIFAEKIKQLSKDLKLVFSNDLTVDAYLYSDEYRLKQILSNLIDNAIKFSENGIIEIKYELKKEHILFIVKDHGIGIEKEHYNIIFERFRQADNQKYRMYGGTGIGLSIVKGLIDLLNGEIWVESTVGKGSSFCFKLPHKKNTS